MHCTFENFPPSFEFSVEEPSCLAGDICFVFARSLPSGGNFAGKCLVLKLLLLLEIGGAFTLLVVRARYEEANRSSGFTSNVIRGISIDALN